MPDWLTRPFAGDAQLPAFDAEMRLLAALGFGFLIALIYRAVRGPRAARNTLLATLVLLTVLIAMTTIVIGDNVARAFAIVGALSIVRFRTVVEDTRDTELAAAIAGSTLGRRLRGIGTARAGAAIEESHEATVADEHAMRSLAAAVRAVPGVLSVDVQVSDR
jgi:multisubunit Na+/H+ antiporter MnhE subunit